MKQPRLLVALALLASAFPVVAQLNIPAANGSDGAFNPTGTTFTVDLSQAIPGDALTFSNSGGDSGKGVYDAARWVIVFKYSSVNVPTGTTVRFANHPSGAPVAWLVQGSVTINGTVSVSGRNGTLGANVDPTEPGPGGFRGGAVAAQGSGAGLGIAGGPVNQATADPFNTAYGNPQLIPLVGGSGASGTSGFASGGSGGGAILIATRTSIAMSGGSSIAALGGNRGDGAIPFSSGGGIRLVADQLTGTGTVTASTSGRVRVEANSISPTITTIPSTITVPPGVGATPTLFQSLTSPTVRIVSVDGLPSPADPTAPLLSSADIAIQKNTPVTIVLETRNFATAGAIVAVRIANKYGPATTLNATLQAGGTTTLSTWTLNTTLAPGFVTLQARATQP